VVEEKTAPSGLRFKQGRGGGVVGDKRRPLRLASSEEGVGWWWGTRPPPPARVSSKRGVGGG